MSECERLLRKKKEKEKETLPLSGAELEGCSFRITRNRTAAARRLQWGIFARRLKGATRSGAARRLELTEAHQHRVRATWDHAVLAV